MPTVQLWPRGFAPALVLVALIWRAGPLVDAAGVAYESMLAFRERNPDHQED